MTFHLTHEGMTMEPDQEDDTSELSESLRTLAGSDLLWARLAGKFLKRLHIPRLKEAPDEIPQS